MSCEWRGTLSLSFSFSCLVYLTWTSSLRMQSQIAAGALNEININFYERHHDGLTLPYAKLQ